ncbi:hypothetical protein DENSPDRAFT_838583 [Dentipellis sp. KUC8613]|nr:hypothetical protein DENSPDRAFT_838583 [Dentipellis sp. KUC8613]
MSLSEEFEPPPSDPVAQDMTGRTSASAHASPISEPNEVYKQHFEEHLAATRAHLLASHLHFRPTLHAPTAHWTPAEKSAFFAALPRYSRQRPDLIATHIGTKSAVDVLVYLDALQAGVADVPPLSRRVLPIAVEVGPALINFEDEQATLLAAAEPDLEKRLQEFNKGEELRKLRNRHRERRGEGERAKSGGRNRSGEKDRKAKYEEAKSGLEKNWEREDALAELDGLKLKALDHMLREAEQGEGWELGKEHGEVGEMRPDELLEEIEDREDAEGGQDNRASVLVPGSSTTSQADVLDMLIDPQLLAESRSQSASGSRFPSHAPLHPPAATSSQILSQPVASTSRAAFNEAQAPSGPIFGHVPIPPPSTPPPTHSSPQEDPDDPSAATLALMSPTSRRRFKKRLYMRRKRAEAAGVEVSMEVVKLKPGRKGKSVDNGMEKGKQKAIPRNVSESAMGGDGDAQVSRGEDLVQTVAQRPEEGAELQTRRSHKGGKTKYQKALSRFEELGIDGAYLLSQGLDLFYYGPLGRLMRVYAGVHDLEDAPDVNTSISVDTVRALSALVVQFTRELVCRAIVVREEDEDLKSQTKAWRVSRKQILSSNVEHALEMMDAARFDKREKLASILPRFGFDADLGEEADEEMHNEDMQERKRGRKHAMEEEEEQEGEGELKKDEAGGAPPETLHAQMYAPFVRIQGLPLPMPTTAPPSPVEDSKGPWAEIDEKKIEEEMKAEAELDRMDRLAEMKVRKRLLRLFLPADEGSDEDEVPEAEDKEIEIGGSEDERRVMANMKRKGRFLDDEGAPKKRSRVGGHRVPDGLKVKSAVFIEDSDAELEGLGDI